MALGLAPWQRHGMTRILSLENPIFLVVVPPLENSVHFEEKQKKHLVVLVHSPTLSRNTGGRFNIGIRCKRCPLFFFLGQWCLMASRARTRHQSYSTFVTPSGPKMPGDESSERRNVRCQGYRAGQSHSEVKPGINSSLVSSQGMSRKNSCPVRGGACT